MKMLRRARKALIAIILVAMFSVPAYSASRTWEAVKTERSDAKTIGKEGDIEVKAARGVVMIATARPVQVRIYTILGQMVSNETVGAGNFQFTVTTHGVYIIKVGDNLTYKVAL